MCPPGGPNSFIFMQFSAKMWKIIAILEVGAPPGENPGSATELCVLRENSSAKARKTTEDILPKTWRTTQFCKISAIWAHFRLYKSFAILFKRQFARQDDWTCCHCFVHNWGRGWDSSGGRWDVICDLQSLNLTTWHPYSAKKAGLTHTQWQNYIWNQYWSWKDCFNTFYTGVLVFLKFSHFHLNAKKLEV